MPGLATATSPIKITLVCTILLVVVLSPAGNAYLMSTCSNGTCGDIDVAPGKYAKELGVDFPNFRAVKLSYPNSTILTNSTGDLLFSVNLTKPGHYNSIDIYIPPDFTGLTISGVWTSFTNNYDPDSLTLSRLSSNDLVGPNWWRVSVNNLNVTSDATSVASRSFAVNKAQYVRIFQVTSPTVAGRYFFKTFINGTSTGAATFPTVVVKASRDPAYISGTLRDAGNTNTSLAGRPISIPNGTGARVLATGIDYLGRSIAAQAFINSTAKGNYTLFGVAPGTYNITAYAAGFVPTTSPFAVSVAAAQSLVGVDIYLKHSVNVTGIVLSLGTNGLPIPWAAANRSAVMVNVVTLNGVVAASTPPPYARFLQISNSSTSFSFSIQDQVGWDGRIPQDFANYTSGLVAGDYILRASVNSYIQLNDTLIHVGNDTALVYGIIQLYRLGNFIVTVHFINFNSTLKEVELPEGTLNVQAFSLAGNVQGRGSTRVPAGRTNAVVVIPCPPGTYHIYASFTTFQGPNLFYQIRDVQGTIVDSGNTTLSFAMVRAGGVLLTIYSADTEKPSVLVPWSFPGDPINFKIIDSFGNVYSFNGTQRAGLTHANVTYSGLLTDDYTVIVETIGYSQSQLIRVHVVIGANSDVNVWMIKNPRIDLTIVFKKEGILSPINAAQDFSQPIKHLDATPVRLEVFDEKGNFAGANITYVSNGNYSLDVTLAGFNRYFGNPRLAWSGFYDTTDATLQDAGGLPPGDYTIRIWVDGYYQPQLISVTLPASDNVSLVSSMEQASRVSGIVLGPDFYDNAVRLSWAVVDLEPGSFTTFTLDGWYQLWVPSGSYNIGISLPGYSTHIGRMEVPSGSDIHADFWLDDIGASSSHVALLWTAGAWLIFTMPAWVFFTRNWLLTNRRLFLQFA
jgi:hypothetical protein